MKTLTKRPINHAARLLKEGGVGVIATDTLYGLVGQALNSAAVANIYKLKRRQPDKPFIILIGKVADLKLFGIVLTEQLKFTLNQHWPGPVSVILPCPPDSLAYLHRNTSTLAFRLPAKPSLRRLLNQTGPLVAPSANPEGYPAAVTISQAQAYFGKNLNFYQKGCTQSKASTLIKFTPEGKMAVLRP